MALDGRWDLTKKLCNWGSVKENTFQQGRIWNYFLQIQKRKWANIGWKIKRHKRLSIKKKNCRIDLSENFGKVSKVVRRIEQEFHLKNRMGEETGEVNRSLSSIGW